MKINFSLTVDGGDSLETKLNESIKSNPTLHMDLVRAFGQSIMLALRLNELDKVSVSGFRVGIVDESGEENKQKKEVC